MVTIACVRTGDKYPLYYVERLHRMVSRHLSQPFHFLYLTDAFSNSPVLAPGSRITTVDVASYCLPGWWNKMLLFSPALRGSEYTIYFDLDMVLVGSIDPLLKVLSPFAICENFSRLAGATNWCQYGSCVMVFQRDWGHGIFEAFWKDRDAVIKRCGNRGDQKAIEDLLGKGAPLLQDILPRGFFLHYKNLKPMQPPETCVVVFGGKSTPENCKLWPWKEWVKI